ncbi:MAG: glycosyltransferase, partial [Lachnospiraceae bacterium]|nr:glycosyltransferase [Lachnospiraceae bacterium]
MRSITVILTCFNRCSKTTGCIKSINNKNPENRYRFIVVDDKSKDSTLSSLDQMSKEGIDIVIINGSGNLYYSGGMRLGIEYALNNTDSDFYLMINDDVSFYDNIIDKMVRDYSSYLASEGPAVFVGCTLGNDGKFTYGGIKYDKGINYSKIGPDEDCFCDTFNANCVLIPKDIFKSSPNIDPVFIHSLGDFDYGMTISANGNRIITYHEFVGICEKNSQKGGWYDKKLSIAERIKAKEDPKGAPFKPWFFYLKKNFGLMSALIHSITP